MRVVIQRVKRASVVVDEQTVRQIGKGLMCLVGIHEEDRREHAVWMCKQILTAKLFEGLGEDNADKRWRSNVKQNGFEVLMVSQASPCVPDSLGDNAMEITSPLCQGLIY